MHTWLNIEGHSQKIPCWDHVRSRISKHTHCEFLLLPVKLKPLHNNEIKLYDPIKRKSLVFSIIPSDDIQWKNGYSVQKSTELAHKEYIILFNQLNISRV